MTKIVRRLAVLVPASAGALVVLSGSAFAQTAPEAPNILDIVTDNFSVTNALLAIAFVAGALLLVRGAIAGFGWVRSMIR